MEGGKNDVRRKAGLFKSTMRGRVEVVCRHELLSERELRESGKSYKDWNR